MSAGASEPPAAAVEAISRETCDCFVQKCVCMKALYLSGLDKGCAYRGKRGADALRALPAAERWRLIGWLAEGLEPTRGMVGAVARGLACSSSPSGEHLWDATIGIRAALAAARDAGDA